MNFPSGAVLLLIASVLMIPSGSPVQFRDGTTRAGIDFRHNRQATPQKYLVETMGSGVAVLDFDRDGHLDIYFVNGGSLDSGEIKPDGGNRLYRNRGDGTFTDVTLSSGIQGRGYDMGAASADFDNDGWTDLYVVNYGKNILFRNRGDGTFEDVTAGSGTGDDSWGSSAAFLDYDNDGDLDLYLVNYLEYDLHNPRLCGEAGQRAYCHPSHFPAATDVLYRNDGDGSFTDVTHSAGVDRPLGKGLGIALWDFNKDGFLEVYIANDTEPNFLYRNNGNGTFTDVAFQGGAALSEHGLAQAGMGVSIADFDEDGRADVFVTNFSGETNALYRQEASFLFRDLTFQAALGQPSLPYVGFGTSFFDYDADGDLDLFVANGHILDNVASYSDAVGYAQPNLLHENRGGKFVDVSLKSSINEAGIFVSRGAAVGDLDNDGDLDLVVSNSGDRPQILMNETPQQNRLLLWLEGKESNRSAIGTRVAWTAGGRRGQTFLDTSGSYLSARDPRLFIGAGEAEEVSLLEVRWPSGLVQKFEGVKAGFLYRLSEAGQLEEVYSLPE